jgi:hypothetical protein
MKTKPLIALAILASTCFFHIKIISAATIRRSPIITQPDYTIYHTKDAIFSSINSIISQCSDHMHITTHNASDGDYNTTITAIHVNPSAATFIQQQQQQQQQQPSSSSASKVRLLLNFGEHGRELISSEIALKLLQALCTPEAILPSLLVGGAGEDDSNDNDANNADATTTSTSTPASSSTSLFQDPLSFFKSTLSKVELIIIPMENTRGRDKVESGDLCERRNGRGVDPNRNWEIDWGVKEKDYDPKEEYPGTRPFSEPEASIMLHIAESFKPHVWLSVHSGMEALFMPWDHKDQIPTGTTANATLRFLHQMNTKVCQDKCAVGSGGKTVGYLAHGTATDYMFAKLGVPLSFTWEIYGDEEAHYLDCYKMFNPITRESYDEVVRRWTAAVFTMVDLLQHHPAVSEMFEIREEQEDEDGDREDDNNIIDEEEEEDEKKEEIGIMHKGELIGHHHDDEEKEEVLVDQDIKKGMNNNDDDEEIRFHRSSSVEGYGGSGYDKGMKWMFFVAAVLAGVAVGISMLGMQRRNGLKRLVSKMVMRWRKRTDIPL